jgi:WD40 repeat protein
MYHKGVIESYPLQVYASALLFSPTESVTRRLFQHEEPKGISIKPVMSAGWSACLQTLEGHGDFVLSVAFSHDSAKLASTSMDLTVKIWDASSGECLQTLEGHSRSVSSVAFSHDSAKLASASHDSTVKIWDVSSGECLQWLSGHTDSVMSVAFSHDSAKLASTSGDRTVKIWDASSGKCPQTLEGHNECVSSVAFSHDSAKLASALYDRTVKIWDASSGECLQTFHGHIDYVMSVAFSHDSTKLASASRDETIRLWDATNGECLQTLDTGRILHGLSFDPTGSFLHTEIGTIALQSLEGSSTRTIAESDRPLYVATSLSSDTIWIQQAGKNMLWVPSEYRPSCSSVSGTTIGLGVGTGRVWFCRISP